MHLTLVAALRRGVRDRRVLHSGLGKYTTDFDNLPERFLAKRVTKVEWKSPGEARFTPRMRAYGPRKHSLTRPWTWNYAMEVNHLDQTPLPIVEPIREEDWMWFRGDMVEVLRGPDKGKFGIIKYIVQERNWVLVEGLNLVYESRGASGDFPGVSSASEAPLLVTTDVRLVDPSTEQGAEVEWRFTEEGDRVRVAVRSGTEVPVPSAALETVDYKAAGDYVEDKEKDTLARHVEAVTYEPTLATFEMDVMRSMGLREDREPVRSYWY